ncbi:MAG: ATP-binding cassette domain-containing protein, partial [Desulfamplus sp.]
LFPGTVSQNIARLGEVNSDAVILAAKKAGVHELIQHFPNGYDSMIGASPGGIVLSGGQRQRIALARALYGNPRLIVLDEPNSNLDEAGERALMQTLAILKQERVTTIVVTHKPSILLAVDKILVMQYGQVARFGPRNEILQIPGQQPSAVPPQSAPPAAGGGGGTGAVKPFGGNGSSGGNGGGNGGANTQSGSGNGSKVVVSQSGDINKGLVN